MNSLKKILFVGAGCLLLSGCSSLSQQLDSYSSYFKRDKTDQQSAQAGEADIDMTYPEMAREMSSGRVQVYGLDDAQQAQIPSAPMQNMPSWQQGIPAPNDPNVIIYPFEDQQKQQANAGRPYLSPPSQQARPLQSPFDGAIQQPIQYNGGPYDVPPPMVSQPVTPDSVSRLYFKHGSAKLNNAGKEVAEYVAHSGAQKITVDGHASERAEVDDPVKRQIVNLEMSMHRAVEVSSQLIREGVPIEKIETRAFGDGHPAQPMPGTDPESASRRVEIHTQGGVVYPVPPAASAADSPASAVPIPPLARY